ncbi:hypothetical protein [Sorangium atrum]|uniref:Uncharacterized protein n=1 Tax=Sorangium atrum TaxID=2995308 RepID=A0ABT5C1C0_9BACT|nr:hypothetical protein [Sorangium aterium]MDC0680142.1 hypothetical protein [Sorangium aterium]
MKPRFSHFLLGTVEKGMFSPQLRSICGTKQLTVSVAQLNEVAERLEGWRAPGFELRARVHLGTFEPEVGPVTALDKTTALVKGVARRIGQASRSSRLHGFVWHVCDGVLALRDDVFLRVLGPTAASLRPWLEECAALRLQCAFPVVRAAGEAPRAPESGWIEFRDNYADLTARAALDNDAVHLDLPLEEANHRFRQSVVGFLCATVDPASKTLPLSPRAREAASRWLCRLHDPGDPERLASWVLENGGSEALARTAADAERSFGGLRSVDRIQRFGGIQMLDRALAEGSVAEWPLQQTPDGPAILVSPRDIDNPDTLACVTEDGRMWAYGFGWDEWERTSDSVRTFLSRIALWGHPKEVPVHVSRSSHGRELAQALGLDEVEEATDSTGTFYAGDAALVFERRLSEGRAVTWLRELRPESVRVWDDLTSST